VPFCCALDERIPQAEPKTAVEFGVASYQRKKQNRHLLVPALFLVRVRGLGLVATTQSRGLISALLRSSVRRGSDSPPDCHSLPRPFKPSFEIRANAKRTPSGVLFGWCG